MTETPTPPWTPEIEAAYWRSRLAKMDADARKADREAKWYPWIALATSTAFMLALGAAGTLLITFVSKWIH